MERQTQSAPFSLNVSSPAIGNNGTIPIEFAAEGQNVAPPLQWSELPPETRSVAIVVEDPDAPNRNFVHWIVAGIPPSVTALPAGARLPESAFEGTNDRGSIGWFGPHPPNPGERHRYFFKVFALDVRPDKPGIDKYDLYAAMKGHVLARGELIATYERKGRMPV